MNKQKSKALKQLGNVLPDVLMVRNHTLEKPLVDFYELSEDGYDVGVLPKLTESNCEQVFRVTSNVFEKVNHHKKLKAAWTKEGVKGVQKYIDWVAQYNKVFTKKYKGMNTQQVDPGLLEIAKSGISSFWKMLIAFLFGFVQIFQNNENKAA